MDDASEIAADTADEVRTGARDARLVPGDISEGGPQGARVVEAHVGDHCHFRVDK